MAQDWERETCGGVGILRGLKYRAVWWPPRFHPQCVWVNTHLQAFHSPFSPPGQEILCVRVFLSRWMINISVLTRSFYQNCYWDRRSLSTTGHICLTGQRSIEKGDVCGQRTSARTDEDVMEICNPFMCFSSACLHLSLEKIEPSRSLFMQNSWQLQVIDGCLEQTETFLLPCCATLYVGSG